MTFFVTFIAKYSNIEPDWYDFFWFILSTEWADKSQKKVIIMSVRASFEGYADTWALFANVITCLNLNFKLLISFFNFKFLLNFFIQIFDVKIGIIYVFWLIISKFNIFILESYIRELIIEMDSSTKLPSPERKAIGRKDK